MENTKGVAVGDVPGTKVEVPCTVFNKDDINAFSISTDEDAVFDEEQSVLYGWDLDNTYFDNNGHETGQFLLIFGYVLLGCFSLVGCCLAFVKYANATSNDEEEKSNDEEDDPSVAAPAEQQLHSSVQSDEQRPNQSKKEAQYDSRSARDVAIELQTRELEQD